ncbi:hypothetical protein BDF14DRAFT_1760052 [Spinellus fusiger]|nr:hypothetical protein BDF14DRAFT_1760052 [Spinellus fusiger]
MLLVIQYFFIYSYWLASRLLFMYGNGCYFLLFATCIGGCTHCSFMSWCTGNLHMKRVLFFECYDVILQRFLFIDLLFLLL